MKPFRRERERPDAPPAAASTPAGPMHAEDDQWFRPGPAPSGNGGAKGRGRGATGKADGSGRGAFGPPNGGPPRPATPDAPTETFTPPASWHGDDTGELAATGGAGAAGAGGAGGSGGGGGGSGPSGPAGSGPGKGKKAKKKKKKRRHLLRAMWAMLTLFTIAFFMVLVAYSRIEIPEANEKATFQTSRVLYAGGEKEIGRFGEVNRISVPLSDVPVSLRDAVLAAENRSFYSDNGVSPKGMLRALWVNLRGGETAQGGSTITQQYVKNFYLTTERSIERKLKEAMISIKIDQEKSKDKILEDYLNTIYLGRGAYGVQAAAKAYFNKDVGKLTAAEGAVLAAVIQSPSRYEPEDPEELAALKTRWGYVADAMVETGAITPDKRADMTFPKFPKQAKAESRYGGQKGYILTLVRKELERRGLDRDTIENGGLRIITTLDPQAQAAAENAVAKEFPKSDNKGLRVGLSAVEPGTGKILAMYGGEDFLGDRKYSQVNNATYPLQAGSTAKIFTTAALLDSGDYTLDSRFDGNSPLQLPASKPVNNQGFVDYGSVTLKRALEKSVNTAFVDATFNYLGSGKVKDAMVKAGIPKDTPGLEPNARITLGIASTPNLQVAGAIATICGYGKRVEEHMVEQVFRPNGGELPIRAPEQSKEPVFSPEAIAGTLEAMQAVVKTGTGKAAQRLDRPAGGKTGTHEGRTAWFSGCTPQLATAVNYFKGDGNKSIKGLANQTDFFGGGIPAETWTTFMKEALRGQPVVKFDPPESEGEEDEKASPQPTQDPRDTSSGFGSTPAPAPPPPPSDPGLDFDFELPSDTAPAPECTSSFPSTNPESVPYDPGCQGGKKPSSPSECSAIEGTGFNFDPGCENGQLPEREAQCQDDDPRQKEPEFNPLCEDGQLPDSDSDSGTDTDGDGRPDSSDRDDDGDGVPDSADPDPLDPEVPGSDEEETDSDGDGVPDSQDPDPLDPEVPGAAPGPGRGNQPVDRRRPAADQDDPGRPVPPAAGASAA